MVIERSAVYLHFLECIVFFTVFTVTFFTVVAHYAIAVVIISVFVIVGIACS